MKRKSEYLRVIALSAALAMALGMAACSGGGSTSAASSAADDSAAGTYTGLYTKFVGDSDEFRVTDEPFSLTLNADGTGTHARDDMEFDVTWTLDGENFAMEETFIGDPIVYEGTLKGDDLDIFNGDPTDDLTCEYVYTKGEAPAPVLENPMEAFSVDFAADETMAMSTTMACGLYTIADGHVYGAFNTHEGNKAFAYKDFADDDGNLSASGYTLLEEGITPNYISVADGYAYYLSFGGGTNSVNRVSIEGGTPEVLCDEDCDYLFMRGERLYFTDGSGQFASCALDGTDKKVLIEKQVAWPYLIDDNWAIYQDVADGQKLHLSYLPSGFDLPITEGPGNAPVIDGTTLWYTSDSTGENILHKMDLSAYDAETETFPDEAGTLPVSANILVGDGLIHLGDYTPADTIAETPDRWDKLTGGAIDGSEYTTVYSLTPEYLLQLSTNADGIGSVFCYKAGSDAGFKL